MAKLKRIRMMTDMETKQLLVSAMDERKKRILSTRDSLEKQTKSEISKEIHMNSASNELRKKYSYNEVNRRAAIAMQFAEKQGRLGRTWKSKLKAFSHQKSQLRYERNEEGQGQL